jgi:hypothetical protein
MAFKDRKRNDFFPEVVVGAFTSKNSHGQILTPNIEINKESVPNL